MREDMLKENQDNEVAAKGEKKKNMLSRNRCDRQGETLENVCAVKRSEEKRKMGFERDGISPIYSLWLQNVRGMTNLKIEKLLEQVGSSEVFYGWSEEQMINGTSLSIEEIRAITASRTSWNPEAEWMRLMEMGISYVSMEQREYPAQLRLIHNPPFGLYYKGCLPGQDGQSGCGAIATAGYRYKEETDKKEAGMTVAEPAIPYAGGGTGRRGSLRWASDSGADADACDVKLCRSDAGAGTYGTGAAVPRRSNRSSGRPGVQAVAIVGARSRSEYGLQIARQLGESLARNGIAVISGLARGIDADAHIGALNAGGRTYAILGCGVDICYPRSNQYLYDRILEHGGGILSEYPPGQRPLAALFPQRNRIISGLSDCLVVVEARKKSGSLITADFAMEQGRDVYAVPGRVGEALSEGTNRLIHQGAGIYMGTEEFLSDLNLGGNFTLNLNFSKKMLEKDESVVYSVLDLTPMGLGTILQKTSFPLEQLLEILASLVEKGYIWESVPNYYVRKL